MSADSSKSRGCLYIVFGFIVALTSLHHYNRMQSDTTMHAQNSQATAEQTPCLASPECQDKAAESASYEELEPVVSSTGRAYFRGLACDPRWTLLAMMAIYAQCTNYLRGEC